MQQHVIPEVFRAFQRLASLQQRRTADREKLVRHQPVGAQAGPLAAAIADGGIDAAALEFDQRG